MTDRSTEKPLKDKPPLAQQVRTKAATNLRTQRNVMRSVWARKIRTEAERKLKAQRHPKRTIWFGLGMMGLIGWAVAIPTLLGVALGLWLDKYYPTNFSWALSMMIIGLFIGCLNAWYWVTKERKEILEELEGNDE
jgi:ATP synthase protein I